MTYDFFADKQDKIEILNFIFTQTSLEVFDLSSPPGQEINQYRSASEIESRFDLENGSSYAITLNCWAPEFGGKVLIRKVELNPKYCKGHTFRYTSEGWGMMQLYFGGIKDNALFHSHIGHFNEKGAQKWESVNRVNGAVNAWNWKNIEQTSRKLKYQIHNKMATLKIGSWGVLKGAEQLKASGVRLMGT
ncbi:MAG: hypothetical protein JST68_23425 [Bacteroidetes bacterium]|nr:hypothetical protein [Bacteroidota bacterium]